MKTKLLSLLAPLALVAVQATDAEPAPLEVGQAAPTFRLNDHEGRLVRVGGESDVWTVLAFYPKAMTPG